MCVCESVSDSQYRWRERKWEEETRAVKERDINLQGAPPWSGVPVLFLTSTKPSLLGSNQSVTLRQAGGTEWSVCVSVIVSVFKCVLERRGHISVAKDE